MHTEPTILTATIAGAGTKLQGRIGAVAGLLSTYRSDHVLGTC